jgi:phosphatidylinositol-3-phosphatase
MLRTTSRARSALVAAALALALLALAFATTAGAATNLIANGTFEGAMGTGSLSGWQASGGTLALVAGNGGGHAARVTLSSGAKQVYDYTASKPVKSATAGSQYQLNGQISSSLGGQTVCLLLKELVGTTASVRTSQQSCLTPTAAWQSFPAVNLTVTTSGDSLAVNVIERTAVTGATFAIDNMSLTAGAPPPPDTTPPSVPQNVAANANGPTSVTVTWSPSTDTGGSGLAGYHVYRADQTGALATLPASATSFTDASVQPSTPYSYTVDAFDGVPNTSVQSSPPAGVTTPAAPSSPCGGLAYPASPPVYQHVVVVMDENLNYSAWHNSPAAPYSNQIASQCASAGDFLAITHPSQPNYLSAADGQFHPWSGSAKVTTNDNLYHQLDGTGGSRTWAALEEDMPSNCRTTDSGFYTRRHNPASWFTDLGSAPAGDGSCATNDVGFTLSTFSPSMLGSFTWVTPNLCHDTHWATGCPGSQATALQSGDTWLSQFLPQIFGSADYQAGNTMVILVFDEGAGENGANQGINCLAVANPDTAGCHIGFVAMSEYVAPGSGDGRTLSTYSMLASIETMWGLPLLGNAQSAPLLGQTYGF